MRLLESNELEENWENIIYPPKQLGRVTLDLTVKKLFAIKNQSQGALDFGGSEYQPVELESLKPKIEDDPKYGWWTLSRGHYIVEYNESLGKDSYLALVYPHQRLLLTGCFHTPFICEHSGDSPTIRGLLVVYDEGVRIKENARISNALTLKTD